MDLTHLLYILGGGLLALLVFVTTVISVYKSLYKKVGPNEVLVISGGRGQMLTDDRGERHRIGFRIVKGGGSIVNPLTERMETISLELITLDIVTPEFYTKMGVPIKVDGVAQIKVKGDDVSIRTAAEQFLNKNRDEIKNIAYQTVAGHLRAILGTLTVEEVYGGHEAFAQRVAEVSAGDLQNMGLEVVSFTIREISDSRGYLEAIGKTRIAQVKRDAQIGEAEANRDATIRAAQASQEAATAKFLADTKIAEADRDYNLKVQDYNASVNQKKAEADLAKLLAEAAGIEAKGLAEAEAVKAQGLAEALAMSKRAEAFRSYNEAAVAQMFIDKLPDIAAAVSAPLSRVDKIVMVNSGGSGSDGVGASRITGEVTNIMAQVPPVIEAMTGIKLQDLMKSIPGLTKPAIDIAPSNGTETAAVSVPGKTPVEPGAKK